VGVLIFNCILHMILVWNERINICDKFLLLEGIIARIFPQTFGSDVAVLIIRYLCVEKSSVLRYSVRVTEGRTWYGKNNVWGTQRRWQYGICGTETRSY